MTKPRSQQSGLQFAVPGVHFVQIREMRDANNRSLSRSNRPRNGPSTPAPFCFRLSSTAHMDNPSSSNDRAATSNSPRFSLPSTQRSAFVVQEYLRSSFSPEPIAVEQSSAESAPLKTDEGGEMRRSYLKLRKQLAVRHR